MLTQHNHQRSKCIITFCAVIIVSSKYIKLYSLHSLEKQFTMPVIAKTEYLLSPEHLLSRHQHHVSGFHQTPTLPHSILLNGNTLNRSLFIFRTHHRACAERRKIGLSYELQVEAIRTGKFLEKIDCPPTTTKHTHSTTKEPEKHSQTDQETTCGTKPEPMDTHPFKHSPLSPLTNPICPHKPHDCSTDTKPNLNCSTDYNTAMLYNMNGERLTGKTYNHSGLENRVLVKTEPGTEEATPHHCASPIENRPTKPTTLIPRGKNNTGPPRTKRRRYSISTSVTPLSSSYSDDAGDDLSLSAEDCISGVISTPHIKPLEEGDDILTTPSPATTPTLSRNKTNAHRTKSTSARATPSPPNPNALSRSGAESNSKLTVKGDLVQDLDEFTKIMEMVTKEQLAKERQATISTTQQQMNITSQRARRMTSPPPYYPPGAQPINGGPPVSQTNYLMQPQFKYPVTPVPRRVSLPDGTLENRPLARPHSLEMHKNPRPVALSGISPHLDSSELMSPALLSTPRTSTPGYPDHPGHYSVTAPEHTTMITQPPCTPTTPRGNFSAFSNQQLLKSPTQARPFFPQNGTSYQYQRKHSLPAGLPNSTPWSQAQQTHNSPQQNEACLPRVHPGLETITSHKRPPTQGQAWVTGGQMREMSLTLPQFSNHYSVVDTTPVPNTGLPPTPMLNYHNHSTLSYSRHHPL